MKNNDVNKQEPDWYFWELAWKLEKEWKRSLPRFIDAELLKIFPKAKDDIPQKISEWEEEQKKQIKLIQRELSIIKRKSAPKNQWFWRAWIKVTDIMELLKIERHIVRLKRLLLVSTGRTPGWWITEAEKQQALAVPIESSINQQLKKTGKALVGLCPFHSEKHSSFYVYPEPNIFKCYGCNRGGNVIKFVMLLYGYDFKEAVKYLLK